ncbi:MAG TPA: hypothetical protein VK176_08020 [Phycisphaerales bacterium]|nr:hypothetical protein [Phycisphaerales bacterium]
MDTIVHDIFRHRRAFHGSWVMLLASVVLLLAGLIITPGGVARAAAPMPPCAGPSAEQSSAAPVNGTPPCCCCEGESKTAAEEESCCGGGEAAVAFNAGDASIQPDSCCTPADVCSTCPCATRAPDSVPPAPGVPGVQHARPVAFAITRLPACISISLLCTSTARRLDLAPGQPAVIAVLAPASDRLCCWQV